jgi:ribosomal protein S18 acetylase RimI-like enzyme
MQIRVARHTEQLREVVAFYRDRIGLVEAGRFEDHAGYDGVFLEVPGTGAHLELTAGGGHGPPSPHPESMLVLYLGDEHVVRTIAGRIGVPPVRPANPYWAEHGLTFEDPDGFRVVLVPERWNVASADTADQSTADPAAIRVEQHAGPRAALRALFELAEDSAAELDGYIDAGRVLVARERDRIVGHVQLTEHDGPSELEIKSVAVEPSHQGRGVGRTLIGAAVALARAERRSAVLVATAAADTGNLRFYQRLGFRMRAIERDAFTTANGYAPGLEVDGIDLRDRVWLDLPLT